MTVVAFGTKGDTLAGLAPVVTRARVLPQVTFTVARWRQDAAGVLREIAARPWGGAAMIVRSSAAAEDRPDQSLAGRFLSLLDIGPADLPAAIDRVIASFAAAAGSGDQVLVQPLLTGVSVSGVAFSRDPATGAPYLVVNYDETGDTAAVTGGHTDQLKVFVHFRGADTPVPPPLDGVVALMRELEGLLGCDSLDVEFAVAEGELYLLQCRPLVLPARPTLGEGQHRALLDALAEKVRRASGAHPYLHGRRTVYGIMPDWNPAEIIGVRPRPLALSLYRRLVTDSIWAYQRHNYGYRNLRSFPLMLSFHGQPYIDVRVSFNSFIPSDVDAGLASRLVDHYVERLAAKPSLHDKVEFEIVLSCYSLDLPRRLAELREAGFSPADCDHLADCLRRLTNRIVHPRDGLWVGDLARVEQLDERRRGMQSGGLDRLARIYWLLEDCKRYGTLPFAGLARAGFVAVQMLRSLVTVGVLAPAQYHTFMSELDTVTRRMGRDLLQLGRAAFLERYGHLRPGTYDILSPRYDEAPDRYFDWSALPSEPEPRAPDSFALTLDQMRAIAGLMAEHRLDMDVVGLFEFIRSSIQGRELAKFAFSRSLSDALSLMAELGAGHGFSRDDMSYCDIDVVERLYVGCEDPAELLAQSIAGGRERYAATCQLVLPPLIEAPEQVWSFHMPPTEPNFITRNSAEGRVVVLDGDVGGEGLDGAVVVLPNADPGFDWIFTKKIAAFITAYGGVNSHMAIRAGELDLPAVIGAGKSRYDVWRQAGRLRIDCASRLVQVLQ
jgi:phosphohistidine swiveling domain-containing protein